VGNVVVHSDFRRRGLGRIVTGAAVEWLRQRGARVVLLDATSDGRPLYKQLGFVSVGHSWYVKVRLSEVNRGRLLDLAGTTSTALESAERLARMRSLDIAAFGGDRTGLVALMLRQPHNWLVTSSDGAGEPSGYLVYGRLRHKSSSSNSYSLHLGPLVARNQAAAAALLVSALREDAPWRAVLDHPADSEVEVRASVPGAAEEILEFYQSAGLELVKDDVLMQLNLATGGEGAREESTQSYPGEARYVYAWLAPMCF
jgi:hypothetical protein